MSPARIGRPSLRPARLRARKRSTKGRRISTLLGTPGYPEHGTLQGKALYGCQCRDCTARDSRERIAIRHHHKAHRVPDEHGRLVSTLLGTPGYPEHGSVSGYSYYHCGCALCVTTQKNKPVRSFLLSKIREDENGRKVSTLLGTRGHPKHGSRSGLSVYGCHCEECGAYSRKSTARYREEKKKNRVEEVIDGKSRMVSTLLGTPGHPEHGVLKGYTEYFCRCPPCTSANTADWVRRDKEKVARVRMTVITGVLTTRWPIPESPDPEQVRELAQVLLHAWTSNRQARERVMADYLADHLSWAGPERAGHRDEVIQDLMAALATTRRGYRPPA